MRKIIKNAIQCKLCRIAAEFDSFVVLQNITSNTSKYKILRYKTRQKSVFYYGVDCFRCSKNTICLKPRQRLLPGISDAKPCTFGGLLFGAGDRI